MFSHHVVARRIFGLLLVAVSAAACDDDSERTVVVVDRTPAEFMANAQREVVVLDVRTPEEYAAGHIDGALNVPVNQEDFASEISSLDREATYVVHCAGNAPGGRADVAIDQMRERGFKRIENLVGGYNAYETAANNR